ncbi:MAG: aminopeptidase N [Bdellovibrionales bacterium]
MLLTKTPTQKKHEIFLKDYKPYPFQLGRVELDVDIQPKLARVSSRIEVMRNPKSKDKKAALHLDGEALTLESVTVNGKKLAPKQYTATPHGLTIPGIGAKAVVEIVCTHDPYNNTSLFGLYKSGNMLSTQCESEGFRRITYYPDRPDVMARFTVTIHADKKNFPVLLSNGNLIKSGSEGKGRHYAVWQDPFPKPAYLFAMVAGKLDRVQSRFRTKSGRNVLLEIYVEPGKANQTEWAMISLKNAMKWDEKVYGLEYDLDRFMIVATPFFNMGAMENKGLNIFNDTCLLGTYKTATDATINFIEKVVGHEYFHNWTGDRVTCRDWFQLSLKEGLTVYRDQEFTCDLNSRAVERLEDVRNLRSGQFSEDAGAMAHPVRPDRYEEIDNFYTRTVYDKGAEVVRMYETLVGKQGFRKGMDLYFKRHDGQAVTCDDYAQAMNDANRGKFNLKQFMLWYSQAGTPVVDVKGSYDAKKKTFTLTCRQSCAPTPGQKTKQPFLIPLAVGLLDSKGRDLIGTQVLQLTKKSQTFTLRNIKEKPVPSLLRGFSAPVRLNYPYSDADLLFLLNNDSDAFGRWEAGFKFATKCLLALAAGKKVDTDPLINALGGILRSKKLDPAFKAMLLSLPGEGELGLTQAAMGKPIQVDDLHAARKQVTGKMAKVLRKDFEACYRTVKNVKPSQIDGKARGQRSLKNLCLSFLTIGDDKNALQQAYKQATTSPNMTEQVAALSILLERDDAKLRDKALKAFAAKWKKYPTIMDKWLMVQASSKRKNTLQQVQKLMKHPAFNIKNPNRVRALLGVFSGNTTMFHAKDGNGYKFIADMVLKVDPINAHAAAGLVKAFLTWRNYDARRQQLMKKELQRMAKKKLSPACAEIVKKSLKA